MVVDQNGNRVLDIPVKYHDQVNLKERCEAKGITASSWSTGGTQIENGILEVKDEGETIVVAIVKTMPKKSKALYYVLSICGLAVVTGGFIFVTRKTKKKAKETEAETDSEE